MTRSQVQILPTPPKDSMANTSRKRKIKIIISWTFTIPLVLFGLLNAKEFTESGGSLSGTNFGPNWFLAVLQLINVMQLLYFTSRLSKTTPQRVSNGTMYAVSVLIYIVTSVFMFGVLIERNFG